jgi:hypothetical protein
MHCCLPSAKKHSDSNAILHFSSYLYIYSILPIRRGFSACVVTCNTSVMNSGRTTMHATGTLHVISFGVGDIHKHCGIFPRAKYQHATRCECSTSTGWSTLLMARKVGQDTSNSNRTLFVTSSLVVSLQLP